MAIKSKIKKIFLLILLVSVSFILAATRLFSWHGGGKIFKVSKAQAQCWTEPGGGGGGGGEGGGGGGGTPAGACAICSVGNPAGCVPGDVCACATGCSTGCNTGCGCACGCGCGCGCGCA